MKRLVAAGDRLASRSATEIGYEVSQNDSQLLALTSTRLD